MWEEYNLSLKRIRGTSSIKNGVQRVCTELDPGGKPPCRKFCWVTPGNVSRCKWSLPNNNLFKTTRKRLKKRMVFSIFSRITESQAPTELQYVLQKWIRLIWQASSWDWYKTVKNVQIYQKKYTHYSMCVASRQQKMLEKTPSFRYYFCSFQA